MARPQRNNVDYFPFLCEEGKKMFYLEETYGNDGFATFVKLLRELAKTNYHYLDLSKNTTTMFLSAKCKVSKETLESIINDLVELGKFDAVLWNENRVVWCQDFTDSIQDAYSKRINNCITYEGLLSLLVGLGTRKPSKSKPTVPVKPQSIVEYTKVEESKEVEFDLFWERYGKKGTRKKALDKWMKLKQPEIDKAFKVVDAYVKSTPDKQYRKGLESWIYNECWNDEIEITKTHNPNVIPSSNYNYTG